ncbi:hypothetical protein BCR44DRAFT_57941 [Catenaria anguillulae PL171]|uniref:G-protein coupled receptors family 1 profile domain-containing protein n=1 Tax=Catenaria anguillulae PL171 TaxID=765915 RepID=A0A1Y2HI96_9FUNG|nr:hypothetical protein BCR44DRAFT_57941 [Catenaria anguillulae PL171]
MNWSPSAVVGIVCASLPVSLWLLVVSCKHLNKQISKHAIAAHDNRNWTPVAIAAAQVMASVGNFVNQSLFLVQLMVPASQLMGGCRLWIEVADMSYFVFQACASIVLIRRATSVVPIRSLSFFFRRSVIQMLFGFVFVCGFTPVVMSVALRTVSVDKQLDVCVAKYHQEFNSAGKIIFFVMYLGLAITFALPLLKHIRAMKRGADKMSQPSRQTSSQPGEPPSTDTLLRKLLRNVTFRILLAVVAYILTALAGLAGFFGNAFQVEFTLQNVAALYAATQAGGSSSRSSGSSGSGQSSSGGVVSRSGPAESNTSSGRTLRPPSSQAFGLSQIGRESMAGHHHSHGAAVQPTKAPTSYGV